MLFLLNLVPILRRQARIQKVLSEGSNFDLVFCCCGCFLLLLFFFCLFVFLLLFFFCFFWGGGGGVLFGVFWGAGGGSRCFLFCFVQLMGDRGSKYHYKWAIIGSPAKRH